MKTVHLHLFVSFLSLYSVGNVGMVSSEPLPSTPIPIVMWHGMGDACCLPFSLGPFKKFLEEKIKNVYVKSIKIGNSITEDLENGYFMPAQKQIDMVCDDLSKDNNLKNGFNAIGFSQGCQFLRGVIQKCGNRIPPVFNFISLGGQHQGVYGLPNCGSLNHEMCDYVRRLLNHAAYYGWVQNLLVQASYWHDPLNEDLYKKHSIFLADINNEKVINETYINNLSNLENFVLVKFNNDTIVEPKETEWFGFYTPGQSKKIEPLQKSNIYIDDRLGLKKMDEAGKLIFLDTDGNHLQFTEEWFIENVINKYLI